MSFTEERRKLINFTIATNVILIIFGIVFSFIFKNGQILQFAPFISLIFSVYFTSRAFCSLYEKYFTENYPILRIFFQVIIIPFLILGVVCEIILQTYFNSNFFMPMVIKLFV